MSPTSLTEKQKLEALSFKYFQGVPWTPAAGHYYTTTRNDLELYKVVKVEGNDIYTEYTTVPGKPTRWDLDTFLTSGFGPKRVWVPSFILGLRG